MTVLEFYFHYLILVDDDVRRYIEESSGCKEELRNLEIIID